MKTPIRPIKPYEPTEPQPPEEFYFEETQKNIYCGDVSISIRQLLEKAELSALDFNQVKSLIITPIIEYNYGDGGVEFDGYKITGIGKEKFQNPNYKTELVKYKAKLKKFPLKMREYEEKMKIYEEKMKRFEVELELYNKWLQEEEIRRARKTLEKYGVTSK